MNINNSKRAIFTPIILSIILVVGISIGYFLGIHGSAGRFISMPSNKIDAILDYILENYVDTVSKEQIMEQTIPMMLQKLDPHSVYIPAKDLQTVNEPLQGNFDGIGVQFNVQNDTVLIINTIPGGPSEKLGVLAGDRIITINDSLFVGKKINSEQVIKHLKGKKGTKVKIGILRKGRSGLMHFEITRDAIPLYSVDVAYIIAPTIGYLKISKFARTTHDEFVLAINKLKAQGMKKVIIDLRSNGGGYLDEAQQLADEFLPEGKLIVYTQGRARNKQEYYATGDGICEDYQVAVLIDTWSASASEIFAGAIQDNDRGLIIGRRSFGKGLVQEPIMFKDGSALRLTIARYYTPTGRCIQKPYKSGENDYEEDIQMRMLHGEFESADSMKYNTNQKFKTPKGKIVYGGGGIMPDIFVPLDTVGYSKYFDFVTSRAILYNFALTYSDQNRNTLKKFKTVNEITNYLNQQNILNQFIAYAEKNGAKTNTQEIEISKKLLTTHIQAYIARNILDNLGFYPIMKDIDATLLKAVDSFSKK